MLPAVVLQLLSLCGICLLVLAGSNRGGISYPFKDEIPRSRATWVNPIHYPLKFGKRNGADDDKWKDYEEVSNKPGEDGVELSIDDLPSDCGSYYHVGRRGGHNRNSSARIAGGTHGYAGSFPSFAYLPNDNANGFCGGVIIHKRYILTVAHCAVNDGSFKEIGVGSVKNMENLITVDRICVNKDYHGQTPADIAILRLEQDIPFNWEVQPACLPLSEPSSDELDRMTSVGMGYTDEEHPRPISLVKLDVKWANCARLTNPNLLCFADRDGATEGRICIGKLSCILTLDNSQYPKLIQNQISRGFRFRHIFSARG